MSRSTQRAALIGLGLLLAFWGTRLASLESFPPFVDEGFHIMFAENVILTGGPLANASEGRLFQTWWLLLFQPYASAGAVWIARAATLLAVLPGFAAVIAIGRLAAGTWGALLCGLAAIFSTYHLFFQRLALADPMSASAVLVALYFAFRLARRIALQDALLCGIACFVAVGAKVSALPYLGLPVLAALTLHPAGASRRLRAIWAAVGTGSGAVLSALLLGLAYWRGYDPLYYLDSGSPTATDLSGLARLLSPIQANVTTMLEVIAAYAGPLGFGLLLAGVIVLLLRRQWFLPLALLLPQGLYWLSARQSSRHLIVPISLLLLCGALALALETRRRPQLTRVGALALVLVWGAGQWLPFALTAARSPADLPLSGYDREEYMVSAASGFGLADLSAELENRQPARVIAILANCSSLHYMNLGRLPIECPRLNPTGEDIPALAALLEASRAPGTLAVMEDLPYAPTQAPGTVAAVIDAPSGRPRLTVYDLSPSG